MKKFYVLLLACMMAFTAGFSQILYEDFNYTVPGNVGGNGNAGSTSNNWTTHNVTTGQTTTIDVLSGSLSYTGLATSTGNRVYSFGSANTMSRDINRGFTSTATVLYFSALVKILDNTGMPSANPDYFMHFGQTSGATLTVFGGRLGAKTVNAGANFRFSIQNTSGGTPTWTDFATDMSFNTTYLVVVKLDRSVSPISASLWVNPVSLGGAEPTGQVTNASGTGAFTAFASVCIRNNATTPKVEIDEVRVGAAWADVTPTGTISAPSVQTSNFTFANVQQTQMDVAWTNGDGARRVVAINTTNSFTDPVNGTDPTANPAYSGSGQQVIYNGSGSTVTVTGLTTSTEYWVKAWEVNGTLTNTVYCTLAGANNPLNHTTAGAPVVPVVSTPTSATITATGATLGGTIVSDGGSAILERGTVWSTTTPVTIASNKVAEGGTATGAFTQVRTGMPNNTLIHYAAYATNAIGTTLSAEGTFTTLLGEPTNHAASFAATSPTYSSITNTWSDNDGTQPATGFLILANTTGVFTDPVDGVQPASDINLGDGSGLVYVNHGLQTFSWTGLTSSTHYYFAIYAYTNTGTNIDYKTVPAAPQTSVITAVFVQPLAAWTFDAISGTPTTPTSVAANFGVQTGTATLYADGTNGSSAWLGTELDAFSGTTLNDPREGTAILAGLSYDPIAATGTTANGKSFVVKFSMAALQDPILTFATRGTSTGFTTHQWAWSTDGVNFTDFGTNTANTTTSYLLRTLDMTAINSLDGAASVYLRVTFTGATNSTGNNRLDNIVIHANAATTLAPTVATNAATNVQATTATVNGSVNANNVSADVSFEYGTATGVYTLTAPALQTPVTGGTSTAVSADLTGLQQNSTYFYRVKAVNANGTSYGNELTFTTSCVTPGDAGQISGPATFLADGTTQYTYTVPAIVNATTYMWSFPSPSLTTVISGDGTNTITVTFASGAVSGNVSVVGINPCDEYGNPSSYAITLTAVPASLSVTGTLSGVACYNATGTITVAGGVTTYTVVSGGNATMIAGSNILLLPGTTVQNGGYLLAKIVPGGPWCPTAKEAEIEANGTGIAASGEAFRIYPNPTTGRFTIERGAGETGTASVEVTNALGGRILTDILTANSRSEYSIKGNPQGLYFVRISSGNQVHTIKIILTN